LLAESVQRVGKIKINAEPGFADTALRRRPVSPHDWNITRREVP
jgi:hypothetical protein